MEISPILLFTLSLYSFLWGGIIGMFNDINRIVRALLYNERISPKMQKYYNRRLPLVKCALIDKISPQKKVRPTLALLLFMQDLALVLVYVFGLVFLNYSLNRGDFRFFTVFVSLFGVILYYFTVGKLLFSLSEYICFVIKAVLVVILFLLFTPFVYILTKIQMFFEKIYLFFRNSIAKYIKKVYNIYMEKELLRQSANAFLKIKNERIMRNRGQFHVEK